MSDVPTEITLTEYAAAVAEHHADFRRIKEIVTGALDENTYHGRRDLVEALLKIDRIVR